MSKAAYTYKGQQVLETFTSTNPGILTCIPQDHNHTLKLNFSKVRSISPCASLIAAELLHASAHITPKDRSMYTPRPPTTSCTEGWSWTPFGLVVPRRNSSVPYIDAHVVDDLDVTHHENQSARTPRGDEIDVPWKGITQLFRHQHVVGVQQRRLASVMFRTNQCRRSFAWLRKEERNLQVAQMVQGCMAKFPFIFLSSEHDHYLLSFTDNSEMSFRSNPSGIKVVLSQFILCFYEFLFRTLADRPVHTK